VNINALNQKLLNKLYKEMTHGNDTWVHDIMSVKLRRPE